MALLPLSRVRAMAETELDVRCAPVAKTTKHRERLAAMELLVLLLFMLVLVVATIAGLTVDSRDSADWKPTCGGFR